MPRRAIQRFDCNALSSRKTLIGEGQSWSSCTVQIDRPLNEVVGIGACGKCQATTGNENVAAGRGVVVSRLGPVTGEVRRAVVGGIDRRVEFIAEGKAVESNAARQGVVAVSAVEDVRASVAVQNVVTAGAAEHIVAGKPVDGVGNVVSGYRIIAGCWSAEIGRRSRREDEVGLADLSGSGTNGNAVDPDRSSG